MWLKIILRFLSVLWNPDKMLKLIVNADDFGLNGHCTDAIARSFRADLITDTTMVANGSAFEAAAKLASSEFAGRVGIHFNLTESVPLTDDIKHLPMFCKDGVFHNKINRLKPLNRCERKAVYEELTAQCNKLFEAGVNPTHADSHHHIHTAIFIAPIVLRVCRENGIQKVRLHRNLGSISHIKKVVKNLYNVALNRRFTTTDFMGGVDDINLGIQPEGTVEIMVHPDLNGSGQIIDRRDGDSPLLECIKYWPEAELISYNLLK